MPKQRIHNEYFRTVSLGGRKTCPGCGWKLEPGQSIWSWGEYIRAKWRTVMHFCKDCFPRKIAPQLKEHKAECGCTFELIGYRGEKLPSWLNLN